MPVGVKYQDPVQGTRTRLGPVFLSLRSAKRFHWGEAEIKKFTVKHGQLSLLENPLDRPGLYILDDDC